MIVYEMHFFFELFCSTDTDVWLNNLWFICIVFFDKISPVTCMVCIAKISYVRISSIAIRTGMVK